MALFFGMARPRGSPLLLIRKGLFMSSTEMASPSKTRTFFRFWFPWFVLSLAALAIVLFWTWPAEDWERLKRVNGTEMTVMLSFLLLLFWFLVFSGLRWRVRLGGTLALVLAVLGSVKGVRFTGDMEPIFQFRWERTHDEILEAQRKSMADGVIPALNVPGDDPADFPEYRGRKRDGVVAGPPLARDWKIQPPKQLWKQPIGGGYAGFAIAGNAAVTIEQRRDDEVVTCYDTLTGQERWLRPYPAHFQEGLGGPGPRATPTIAEDDVYALGATGRLVCLELRTGRAKWAVD